MLTKERIMGEFDRFELLDYDFNELSTIHEIYKQAISAIDLAAENERLKARNKQLIENGIILSDALDEANKKLDAVRAECEEWRQSGRPLSPMRLLAIIDKDGDTDAQGM